MSCRFCGSTETIVDESKHWLVIRDDFPISEGHTLIIPRRHLASIADLNESEFADLQEVLRRAKLRCAEEFECDGFNIGINDGLAAGQTVMHLHIHLIPRYAGDCEDPRGGVRWLFPEKAKYWK